MANPAILGLGDIAFAINNPGQAVGTSTIPSAGGGPSTANHAFLWTRGTGMRDLGTLPGDVLSAGLGINDGGDVVGGSIDAEGNPRAFFWRNGAMSDLNTISHGAPLFLLTAFGINASGEIVGMGATAKGDIHAFVAIPGIDPAAHTAAGPIVLSEEARAALRHRGFVSRPSEPRRQ